MIIQLLSGGRSAPLKRPLHAGSFVPLGKMGLPGDIGRDNTAQRAKSMQMHPTCPQRQIHPSMCSFLATVL
jgi:hypothetical protein